MRNKQPNQKHKVENHRRTVHGMIEISKQRQTAVVNPTLKGKQGSPNVDYMPNTSSLGSLSNLLDISTDSLGSPIRERHHSAGSQSLTKINQINIEPEFTQTTKKIKHQKSSSFSTLKRAKKEW